MSAGSVGTGDISLMSGGDATSGASTSGNIRNDGIGASLDLSGAWIQGHTINDGLDAQETAYLFDAILGNTANTVVRGVNNTLDNITNSTGFKLAIVGISAFIIYTLFSKKR